MKQTKVFISSCMVVITILCSTVAFSGDGDANSTAIFPFEVHASKDLTYLKNGIRDMLASRLASGAGVKIVNRIATESLVKGGQAILPEQYQEICEKLKADYLVIGSFTSLGGGASIDAKVYAAQTRSLQDFFATAAKEDDVILAINNLAWDIGEKIFGKARPVQATRPMAAALPSAGMQAPTPAYQTAHPERAFMGSGAAGKSPFIRPGGVGGPFGFKKSKNFPMNLQALDVGDVDGDGIDEVVLADRQHVMVYRVSNESFTLIGKVSLSPQYKAHYLSMADLNGNGMDEIYVSANEKISPNSFALEWQDDKLIYLFQDAKYYIRAMDIPVEGEVLVGQRGGMDSSFEPGISILELENGKLRMGAQITDLKKVNIFDFVMLDMENDGRTEIVSIDQSDLLRVMNRNGKKVWKSADYYGGTKRFVGELEQEISGGAVHRYYLPSRIIATDLNNDQRMDIIVNKNLSSASRVFRNLKSYPNGEIHGMAWNGIALAELWRTSQIDGYIADYQLRKIDDTGKAILYVGVVLSSGIDEMFTKNESTILMYPLDFSKEVKSE